MASSGVAATLGVTAADGYATSGTGLTPSRDTQATTCLLIFAQWELNSAPPAITDNKGNTYGAPFRTLSPGAGSLNNFIGAWFISGAAGGAAHVITATKADAFPSVWVVEVADAVAISHIGASSTASPYSSGSLTTNGERLLIGFCAEESTGAMSHTINSSGYTQLDALSDGAAEWTGVTAHRTAPAGTYSFSVSASGAGVADGGAILVAVQATEAGGQSGGADGVSLSGSLSLAAGAAAATRSGAASGATLSFSSALLPGAASGVRSPTASGATLSLATSLAAGAPSAGQTAAGASLSASLALAEGAASGGSTSSANGASLSFGASLAPGAASGAQSPSQGGATLAATLSLAPGAAAGQSNG
ncbi:MAG: hypothetical protein ACRC2H_13470, partial [Silanimonas sp.]